MMGGEIVNYISEKDTETHRICGTCGEPLPLKEFYKDGKDSEGKVKYRRDCKQCYKNTRVRNLINTFK